MLTIVSFLPNQKSCPLHRHCLSIHALPWQALLTALTFSVSSFIPFLLFWTCSTLFPPVPCSLSHNSFTPESAQVQEKNKTKIPYQTKSPSVLLLSFAHHLFIAPCKRRPHKQPEAWLSQKYKVNCITDSFHHSYTHTNRKTSSIQKRIHTGPAVSAVHADASKTYYGQTCSCSCAVTES